MGIIINLTIHPHSISEKAWRSVYDETLDLIAAYPFADRTSDAERFRSYGLHQSYYIRTMERDLSRYASGCRCSDGHEHIGWAIDGSLSTWETAESFLLYRDLLHYREWSNMRPSQGHKDALRSLLRDNYEALEQFHNDSYLLFDAKTQGYDYHLYVLAIACLIESRLAPLAIVHGDISKGQCLKAIEWANKFLKKPITAPDRFDDEKLLGRLRKFLPDGIQLLKAFFETTQSKEDLMLGEFIRKNFDEKAIYTYFLEDMNRYAPGTFGASDSFQQYLEMGFGIDNLCKICVSDKNGPQYDPMIFIKQLMKTEIYKPAKDTEDVTQFAASDPAAEDSDTVYSLFGKMFMKMAGMSNVRTKAYVPLEDLISILKWNLPSINVEAEIAERLAQATQEDKKHEERLSALLGRVRETDDDAGQDNECGKDGLNLNDDEEYDITDYESLIFYERNDRIHPSIMKSIATLQEFVQKNREPVPTEIEQKGTTEKLALLVRNCRFVLPKEIWDFLEDNISNADIYETYLIVFCINAEEIKFHAFIRAFLFNRILFQEFLRI